MMTLEKAGRILAERDFTTEEKAEMALWCKTVLEQIDNVCLPALENAYQETLLKVRT